MSNVIEFSIKALDDFSANMNKLDKQLGSLKTAFQAFGGAIGAYALISFSEKLIAAVDESDKASIKLNKILENTGYAAGTSRQEIEGYVDALTKTTRFDDEGIRNASSELLKFGYIAHDTFKNALTVAADFAAFSGSSIEAAAAQMGRAMANPEQASRLLLKAGVDLSEAQKEEIKRFEELGDKASSQALILGELQRVYGGLAAEMNGTLGGALARVKNVWNELMEDLGKNPIISGALRSSLEGMAAAINLLRENIDHIAILFQALSVAATVFIGLKIAEVVLAIAGSFTVASLSIAGATAAMRAFMLTNPIGWVTLAVGLGVLAWDEWKNAAESATKEAEKGLSQVVEVLDRWEKIIGEGQAKKKIEDTARAFKELKDAAEAYAPIFEQLTSTLKDAETPYAAHIRRLKEIDNLQKALGGTSDELTAAIKRENDEWKHAEAVTQEYKDSVTSVMSATGKLIDDKMHSMGNSMYRVAVMLSDTYFSVTKGIGDAVGEAIVSGKSLGDSLESLFKQVLTTAISTLVQIGIQRIFLTGVITTAYTTEAIAATTSAATQVAAGNAVTASWTAASAAMMGAAALAGIGAGALYRKGEEIGGTVGGYLLGGPVGQAVSSIGDVLGFAGGGFTGSGARSGGLDGEGGFIAMLHPNETVIDHSAGQTIDSLISDSSQSVVIQSLTIHVLENATNVDAFTRMDKIQLRNSLGQPVVDALNEMFNVGIRPNFAMQNNR